MQRFNVALIEPYKRFSVIPARVIRSTLCNNAITLYSARKLTGTNLVYCTRSKLDLIMRKKTKTEKRRAFKLSENSESVKKSLWRVR